MVSLKPTQGIKQPIVTTTGDRPSLALAMLLQFTAPRPKPLPTPAMPGQRPLRINRHLPGLDRLAVCVCAGGPALAAPGSVAWPAPSGAASFGGVQLLGQLITATIAEPLILLAIGLLALAQNLRNDLTVGTVLIRR
jgi:hypothetical protein